MWIDVLLEKQNCIYCSLRSYNNFCINLCLFPHEDLSQASATSTSGAQSLTRTIKRKTSASEYSTLQEVSFQRIIVAVGISYLLYPVHRCGYADDIWPNAWKEI